MVPIKGEWTPFVDIADQLDHYRLWGLIPPKSKKLRPIMVVDGYWDAPEPCNVVGFQGDNWAVIELADGFHAIHGDYLAELQPIAYQKLPVGVCFAEILSKYVVVDIETTGFDFRNDRIIEIAAITYEYGKRTSEFHSLVNPERLIPSEVIALTGISQADVDAAPVLDAIKGSFLDFIGDLPIIGHNALTFDVPFLSSQLSVAIENSVIDTLPMARKVFELLPRHKLAYLNDVLQLGSTGSHRAFNDVETTNALLWACLAPRKYERNVHKAFLDDKMNPDSNTNRKKSVKQGVVSKNYKPTISFNAIPPKYVVIDIETTGFDFHNDRIIEIAAIFYENGKKSSEFHSLVNPGRTIPGKVVSLTGISQADVDEAPALESIKPSFLDFIGDMPVVGHNAQTFDVPFLSAQLHAPISNHIIDTLSIARNVFPLLPKHKLEYLNEVLQLGSAGAHRAFNDVETTNALLWACLSPQKYQQNIENALRAKKMKHGPASMQDINPKALQTSLQNQPLGDNKKKARFGKVDIKSITPSTDCTNTSSPLCGKAILFTGELTIPRSDAMQMAVDAGAVLKSGVSKKLEYLVVGKQDVTLVGMEGMSGKEIKARELNESGKAQIQIIDEEEFLKLIRKEGATV